MRPSKTRKIGMRPRCERFRPTGASNGRVQRLVLALDEFEAVRLTDHLGMTQEEAAELMEISRPTLTRLVERAHAKVAEMLVNGSVLEIEGGNVELVQRPVCGCCGREMRTGSRRSPCCESQRERENDRMQTHNDESNTSEE